MKTDVDIRIVQISPYHSMNNFSRWEMMRYREGTPVEVSMSSRLTPYPEKDMVSLIIGAKYTAVRTMIRRVLLDYSIEIVYEIPEIENAMMIEKDRVIVPNRLITLMLSVGIGTLRGMLAATTASTPLKHCPLPIINVSEMVSRLAYGTPATGMRPLVNFIYE